MKFYKMRDSRRLQLKLTNMTITSKRFVKKGPNLSGITHSETPMRVHNKKMEFSKSKMAAGRHLEKH